MLFLTTTQIGIDADSKSQSTTIGYERYEGYIGPGYKNGGVPPVIARLESNLSVIDPKVSQVYALVMQLALPQVGRQSGKKNR